MFKAIFRGGLLLTLLLGTSELKAQGVSFLPNGSLTGVTSSGTTTTFTTPILLSNGTVSAPALAFSSATGTGLYLNSTYDFRIAQGGFDVYRLTGNSIVVASNGEYQWSATTSSLGAVDVRLTRDAANTLALRNGVNAQAFNIYNTYTDASNYERGGLLWSGNLLRIFTANAGTGTARAISIEPAGGANIQMSSSVVPTSSDAVLLGGSAQIWAAAYVARSIQGSKSKALVDNTATAFVRLSVADDDYEGCGVVYTAYAEDTATDARQTRTGRIYAAILNNSGTEAVAFSTGDSAVSVTAGTFTCTFDGTSGAADTIDLRATCDTSLAATTTLTFEYRLDCPSTVTVTPQ